MTAEPAPAPCRALAVVLLALLAACGGGRPSADVAQPASPPPATSVAPMRLGGQRVLVLPVQAVSGVAAGLRERVDAELLFALSERDPRVSWVAPEVLIRALRRSPGFAADPRSLPSDPLLHHGERRAVEPLAGELRRYAALTDARWVLLPRGAAWVGTGEGGEVRLSAVVVDARSGDLLWWGEAAGERRPSPDAAAVGTAAAELARRLVATAPP